MIWAELKKMKRHYLLPLSIGVVVLSSLLALFQLIGATNSVVGYLPLTDGILWNNLTLTFPFLITFFGGFLMNREYSEDTLKSNLIIPVPYKKLVFAKIAVTGFAVILFIIASFLCSIVFAVILGYPLEMKEVGMAFWETVCHRNLLSDSGDAYYCTLYLEKKSFFWLEPVGRLFMGFVVFL